MDSGVQIGINQVDEEIAGHHHGGEQKVGSGDDRVVSFLEGQQEDPSQAGQGKEVLEDHGAPIRIGNCRPIRVITGMRAFLVACLRTMTFSLSPLAQAVRI